MLYAQVVLPLAQPIYTFSLNEELAVEVGDAVVVQFGSSRYYTGLVWNITTEKPDYPRLKPILKKLYSHPIIGEREQRLWEWIADYYMCTLGEVMRLALPSLAKPSATSYVDLVERAINEPTESFIALAEELQSKQALVEYVEKHRRRSPRRVEMLDSIAALASERKADDGFVPRRLVDATSQNLLALRSKGLIRTELRPRERLTSTSANNFLLPTLSEAQQLALAEIRRGHDVGNH